MIYLMVLLVVVVQLVQVYYLRRISMSTPPGLLALNKAIQDLVAAIQSIVGEINTVLPVLQASEDPAVQQAAATIETGVGNLNQATQTLASAAAPPATPPTAAGSKTAA